MTLGVDPGKQGGIALVDAGRLIAGEKIPKDPRKLAAFFQANKKLRLVVEKVPRFCGQKQIDEGIPGASVASVYGNYQLIVGIWVGITNQLPIELTPQTWQRAIGCERKNFKRRDDTPAWKRHLRARAEQIFKCPVPLWLADAALIAHAHDLNA